MRRAITTLVIGAVVTACFIWAAPALAGPLSTETIVQDTAAYATPAELMDKMWLQPRGSDITGEMVQNLWRWYGVPPHVTLTILAAETSLGHPNPAIGGRLVGYHNYGCLTSYNGFGTKWGMLADGEISLGARRFFTFPSMEIGMMALGRLLKVGPTSQPGYYLDCFKRGDWVAFAAKWNPGGGYGYALKLMRFDETFRRVANERGWRW